MSLSWGAREVGSPCQWRGERVTAATTKETVIVKNVHEFPGHIACDGATNSEIVIPIVKDGQLIGVLDIDSPSLNRFNEIDQKYLEKFVQIITKNIPSA